LKVDLFNAKRLYLGSLVIYEKMGFIRSGQFSITKIDSCRDYRKGFYGTVACLLNSEEDIDNTESGVRYAYN
jgi:hypothetical protein